MKINHKINNHNPMSIFCKFLHNEWRFKEFFVLLFACSIFFYLAYAFVFFGKYFYTEKPSKRNLLRITISMLLNITNRIPQFQNSKKVELQNPLFPTTHNKNNLDSAFWDSNFRIPCKNLTKSFFIAKLLHLE